ncbi:MAG: asparagine synthase (glutamine-hydrolyzing) [Flavobacteriaceae bacterium]|nr:asparagine synthase (glutamine-hydrolyzing) [Flavobacteriaceae bacterium]
MCGINGFVISDKENTQAAENRLKQMNDAIIHRGPDDAGSYITQLDDLKIGLGMRRLSIIDLTTGNQPFYSEDKQIVLVFNGEIYNFLELKKELISKGVSFHTSSDTEVILKLYETEGEQAFDKLDGMFAFSVLDKNRNKLFIARDFFGEKPLYYYQDASHFVWASELKSILKVLPEKPEISALGINYYFRLTYIPAPFTIYENIHKLEANHMLSFDLTKQTFEITVIDKEAIAPQKKLDISFEEAKQKTKKLVTESVQSRSISDVPLGTFLSGGVDSSIVSWCLAKDQNQPINTFSIGFEKKAFDETDKSRVVADQIGSKHHEFILDENDLIDDIDRILRNFDEPFSDTASLPTFLVSSKTREHVKVALTGDGGDEVFGGYNKYYIGTLNKRYTKWIPKAVHEFLLKIAKPFLTTKSDLRGKRFKIKKMLNSIDYKGNYYWDIISLGTTQKRLQQIIKPQYQKRHIFDYYKHKLQKQSADCLTDFRAIDKIVSLEGGMLPKVDRTSMLASLECRAPFLSKTLWKFTNSLPEDYLLDGWNKKKLLKEAFKSEFPADFLEKSKKGFDSPVGDWLRSGLREELESYIDPEFLKKQHIFETDAISKLVQEHLDAKADNTDSVWTYYCFQKWYVNQY